MKKFFVPFICVSVLSSSLVSLAVHGEEKNFPNIMSPKYQLTFDGDVVSEELINEIEQLDKSFDIDNNGVYDKEETKHLKNWHKELQKNGLPIQLKVGNRQDRPANSLKNKGIITDELQILSLYWGSEKRDTRYASAQFYAKNSGPSPVDSLSATLTGYRESSAGSGSYLAMAKRIVSTTNIPASTTSATKISDAMSITHGGQKVYFRADGVATEDAQPRPFAVSSNIF